jgi:hypothetical protein
MQTVLNDTHSSFASKADLTKWQHGMHERIQQWFEATPSCAKSDKTEKRVLENFELTYYRLLFYLYHPAKNITKPSHPALLELSDAARNMIQLYRRFLPERRLTIYWQAIENLHAAGTGLLYAFVHCPLVQDRIPVRTLETLIYTCSSTLFGLVEHFPAMAGKRDAFDLLASKVLADINNNVTTPAAHATSPMLKANRIPVQFGGHSVAGNSSVATETMAGNDRSLITASAQPMTSNGLEHTALPSSCLDFDLAFDWESFDSLEDFLPLT